MITAILPVSRTSYLDRVLESYQNQTLKPDKLIIVVNGDQALFDLVESKKLHNEIYHIESAPASSIHARRRVISEIHNLVTVGGDWVFSFEDDGVLPANAVARLLRVATERDAGVVSGVELGRWGLPYVGAWTVDDVFEPSRIKSLEKGKGVEEIDAAGLYCCLIRSDLYNKHIFHSSNGLGPDVNLGLYVRQHGFKNYIDWSIGVTHLTNYKGLCIEIPPTDTPRVVQLIKRGDNWTV